MSNIKFVCCLCGNDILHEGVDPCALSLITRWQEPEDKQNFQQYWVHAECFQNKIFEHVGPIDILQPDDEELPH